MNHKLSLRTICDSKDQKEQLSKLFSAEDKNLSNGRATYDIKEKDLELNFIIEAKDAVALRATITSISKTLDVFERMEKIVRGE